MVQQNNAEGLFKHSAKEPGQDVSSALEPPPQVRGRPEEELITVISVSHPNTTAKNRRDSIVIHRLGQSEISNYMLVYDKSRRGEYL